MKKVREVDAKLAQVGVVENSKTSLKRSVLSKIVFAVMVVRSWGIEGHVRSLQVAFFW
jgi:hypothetical protein